MKKQQKQSAEKDQPIKVISSYEVLRRTWLEFSTFWRPLVGITLVYAVLYFVFVTGFSITNGFRLVVDTNQNRFLQAINGITTSLNDVYAQGQSDATVLIQMLLFVIASLAIVWSLRKLQALKKITIRDAFYQGPAQIIPVLLVSAVLLLTLIPAVFGSSILTVVLMSASTGVELIIVSVVGGVLLLVSAWLFSMFWPAFYIASLPQTRPVQALKSAKAITKRRRLSIIRKLIILGLVVVVAALAILLPAVLIVPTFAQYFVYAALFAVFLFTQIYLYELYRSLL